VFNLALHSRGQFFDGQRLITSWDGTEIRLLWLMAEMLNFSFTVEEPADAFFLYVTMFRDRFLILISNNNKVFLNYSI
jgi:hypothetical protein